jgi:N-acetylmuramoyl-L-alanine amidase
MRRPNGRTVCHTGETWSLDGRIASQGKGFPRTLDFARLVFMRLWPGFLPLLILASPVRAERVPNSASATIPPRPSRLSLPPVQGPRRVDAPLVVIDAGHGGHDPGSSSSDGDEQEKDVALKIARAIRDELLDSGKVRVAMTRSDDRFLVLQERREIARRLHADLFISVHCDSAPNNAARGASIYTLSETSSDRVAAALAARENKADVINGIDLSRESNDVSSILIDLAQRETLNTSSTFAFELQRELSPLISLKPNFHKFAGLMVLKAPDVPSVLLETGYISNDDDLALLTSEEYRRKIALGVRRAVEAHFARQLVGKTRDREELP